MDRSQRRELAQEMSRSTGSYELVFSTLLLTLIGFGLDHWFGTTPYITVVCAVVGFLGASIKLFYSYKLEMDEHAANAPWARPAERRGADIPAHAKEEPSHG